MYKRLLRDFQLSILTLMGAFTVTGLTPYAVYRWLNGNLNIAILDATMVLCALLCVAHAWRTGDTEKPGLVMALIVSCGAVLVTLNIAVLGLFWFYVLILFNFFVVRPVPALLLTLSTLVAIIVLGRLSGSVFDSDYQMTSFLVTALIASMFAFVFAVRTRHQRDRLVLLATLDPLTGAGNRRSMSSELNIAVASRERYGTSLAVLAMDLDHFKQVNDRYGHSAGDKVLVDFVKLVKSCVRKEDRLFRFGGEEFLLLLPNTDHQGVSVFAQNLREKITERLRSPAGPITVSMGGALLRTGESADSWLNRADEMLYRAKHAGRDRVFIEDLDVSSAASAPTPAYGET
jgi:diguanylate cyclase (GGDEF)-like protein